MRHFNFYENGGPFPSTCVSCGNNKELFDLGRPLPFNGGSALLCITCSKEIAEFIGYTDPTPLEEELEELTALNVSRETAINRIPNLVEGLIDGIRGKLTDFVFAVSYEPDIDQPEDVQNAPVDDGGDSESGSGTKQDAKTPRKPASK